MKWGLTENAQIIIRERPSLLRQHVVTMTVEFGGDKSGGQ